MLWLRVETLGVVVQWQWQFIATGVSLPAHSAGPRDAGCQDIQGPLSNVLAGANSPTKSEAGEVLQVGIFRQRLLVRGGEFWI